MTWLLQAVDSHNHSTQFLDLRNCPSSGPQEVPPPRRCRSPLPAGSRTDCSPACGMRRNLLSIRGATIPQSCPPGCQALQFRNSEAGRCILFLAFGCFCFQLWAMGIPRTQLCEIPSPYCYSTMPASAHTHMHAHSHTLTHTDKQTF